MEPLATTLTVVALKQTVTHLTKKLLDKAWDNGLESGKKLLRQLSEDYAASVYVEKYVSRYMKMRTLHSAESDVFLDEIYSPLKLDVQSNKDEIVVEDGLILDFSRVINIIGIAGQGKSTILRKLFLEEMNKAKRFPFLIELRRVEDDKILDCLKQQLKDIGLVFGNGDVEMLLQSNKIVLMLDGFDEIPSKNRNRLLHEIIQLNTRYSCNVIVTSRPGTEICNEVDVTNLKVKNLDCNDIVSIIDKLDKRNEQCELKKLIHSNVQLQETLVSPILVNLLYICYPYLDVVPESVVDFYDKLFITLYSRHDKIKNFNREKFSSVSAIDAWKIFNAFCFDSLNKNVLEFNEETLYGFLNSAIKLNQLDCDLTEKIQHDLINITCLVQKDGFDKYVFLHKSVQEYHAAKFISSLPHNHKENFYTRLSEKIDLEDKFDNVLLFLKHIDEDDYNKLLVMRYFEDRELSKVVNNEGDHILNDIIKEILKDKEIELTVVGDHLSCEMMTAFVQKNFLATISFFKTGNRKLNFKSENMFSEHLFMGGWNEDYSLSKVTVDEIRKISMPSKFRTGKNGSHRVRTLDYLKVSGIYDLYCAMLKGEIIALYNEVYLPIFERNKKVSEILDISFNV